MFSSISSAYSSQLTLLLICRDANVDAKDIDYYTPLLTAAEFGRIGCFKLLLRHGAAIKKQNKDGKNAVFLAAESNHPEIIEVSVTVRDSSNNLHIIL